MGDYRDLGPRSTGRVKTQRRTAGQVKTSPMFAQRVFRGAATFPGSHGSKGENTDGFLKAFAESRDARVNRTCCRCSERLFDVGIYLPSPTNVPISSSTA